MSRAAKSDHQIQQQMDPLGHCNVAEMYFKNIISQYQKHDPETEIKHTTTHLASVLGGKKSPSLLFIQITDNLLFYMRLNKIPLSYF